MEVSINGTLKSSHFLGNFPWVPQVRLNALCMRIAKRPLEKGETLYDTQQIGVGKDLCCIGSVGST